MKIFLHIAAFAFSVVPVTPFYYVFSGIVPTGTVWSFLQNTVPLMLLFGLVGYIVCSLGVARIDKEF